MRENEREQMRRWVNNWKETGKILEKLRREEIRSAKITETIGIFDDAFRSAVWLNQPEKTSGLVEFHRILRKSR